MKLEKLNFEEQVTQVICDDSANALAIELRDKEKQKLKLLYLDLQTTEQWVVEDELSWWHQLQACSQGKLILNGFEDPSLPMSKGVFVFDAKSGRKMWEKSSAHFLSLSQGDMWMEEQEERIFVRLHNGKPAHPPAVDLAQKFEDDFQHAYQACEVVYRLSEEFPSLQNRIEKTFGHQIEEYLDYLKMGAWEIFSYPHKHPEGGWDQEIRILKNGEVKLARKTGRQLKGIAWSTFFVWRNYLIWQEGYRSICFSDLG